VKTAINSEESRRFDKENGKDTATMARKQQHLDIVANQDVAHGESNLLRDVRLVHQALPELDLEDIDLSVEFFGKRLQAPLMITSMTGGAESAKNMNHELAEVAERHGIAFSVGSQRVMLDHPETSSHFEVRDRIPNGVFLGNIGAVQLPEYSLEAIAGLVERTEADGICVHLNPAQELVQNEGDTNFSGLLDKIAQLVNRLDGRVLVKETGAGMSPETLNKLAAIGVRYVDVAGSGGTSWTKVEKYRADSSMLAKVAMTFADWGVPTAFSVFAARKILDPKARIVASGGVFDGLDVARAIALGADIAGFARSILFAFMEDGIVGASLFIKRLKQELKTAMLLTGAKDVSALQSVPRVYTGKLNDWFSAYNWTEGE
jgi:isopentenyl-diphosphate delta-isomerase